MPIRPEQPRSPLDLPPSSSAKREAKAKQMDVRVRLQPFEAGTRAVLRRLAPAAYASDARAACRYAGEPPARDAAQPTKAGLRTLQFLKD